VDLDCELVVRSLDSQRALRRVPASIPMQHFIICPLGGHSTTGYSSKTVSRSVPILDQAVDNRSIHFSGLASGKMIVSVVVLAFWLENPACHFPFDRWSVAQKKMALSHEKINGNVCPGCHSACRCFFSLKMELLVLDMRVSKVLHPYLMTIDKGMVLGPQ